MCGRFANRSAQHPAQTGTARAKTPVWGEDAGNSDTGGRGDANPLKLKVLANKLLKESKEELAKHHTAGADSVLHRRLGYALYGLSRAPCRLKEESHEKRPLSNGSDVMECALCKERF